MMRHGMLPGYNEGVGYAPPQAYGGFEDVPYAQAVPVMPAPNNNSYFPPPQANKQQHLHLLPQFTRYDQLGDLVNCLGDASTARARGEAAANAQRGQVNENAKRLQAVVDAKPRATRRLHRNAHPRFLHYFQFNREAKVIRLEQELAALNAEEAQRRDAAIGLEAELARREQDLASLRATEQERTNAVDARTKIFETIVAQHPSALLLNIQQQVASLQRAVELESQYLTALNQSQHDMRQVQQLFNRAARCLDEANGLNQAARVQVVFDHNNNRHHRDEMAERAMQYKRDNKINEAKRLAERASMDARSALSRVPLALRERYPALNVVLDDINVNNMQGGNFFDALIWGDVLGRTGNWINDGMAERKIRDNVYALQRYENTVASQINALAQMAGSVDATKRALEQDQARSRSDMDREKMQIFQSVRPLICSLPGHKH